MLCLVINLIDSVYIRIRKQLTRLCLINILLRAISQFNGQDQKQIL